MLRHETLNGTAVIRGRAETLEQRADTAEAGEHVEPIVRRGTDIKGFVKQSRQLMESLYAEPEFEQMDLAEEATVARELDTRAEIVVGTPSTPPVEGDVVLGQSFGNLLSNVIEHNDSEPPRVTVATNTGDDPETELLAASEVRA